MKIFIVSRGVPSENNHTLGIFEHDQAKALAAGGHDVLVLSLDLRSFRRKRKWGLASYERDGIKVEEINVPVGAVPKSVLIGIGTCALKKLLKHAILKHGEPDIVHSHFFDISYMTQKALDGKYKQVITEHSSFINTELTDSQIRKYGSMYAKADLVIAVSRALCNRMERLFGVKAMCINNIVDTDIFKARARDGMASDGNPFGFITVANLTPNKRVDLVVDAAAGLIKEVKNLRLTIAGDGEERSLIEKKIRKHGISSHVQMLGKIDRKKICEELSLADCFVLASNSETFGLAYIEAIASGLPVIATRCGGPEDFVGEGNGLLIERDSLNELIEAMRFMYENAKGYDHEKISKDISERFSAKNISKQISDAYARIL